MKSRFIYTGLFLAICVSMYFVYERSFVTRDFEVVNSEEISEEEGFVSEDPAIEVDGALEAEPSASEE